MIAAPGAPSPGLRAVPIRVTFAPRRDVEYKSESREAVLPTFPEQLPHGEIQEIFPDVYFVKGQMKLETQGRTVRLTRSMTIVRQGDSLSLVNPIRLGEEGLQALDRLGKVENVLRMGVGHGRDDAFYSDRYNVPVWAQEGTKPDRPVKLQATLAAGNDGPLKDATILMFESIAAPETVICLHRNGGILITCDCIQNMTGPDEFFDAPSSEFMANAGFFRRANIGPAWRARLQPKVSDYDRILALDFKHLLPAHGDPLLNEAHEAVAQTVKDLFSA